MATDRDIIDEAKDRRARVQTYDEDVMSVCTSLMDNLIAIAEKSLDKTCESCKEWRHDNGYCSHLRQHLRTTGLDFSCNHHKQKK